LAGIVGSETKSRTEDLETSYTALTYLFLGRKSRNTTWLKGKKMATYFIAPFEPVNDPEQWEDLKRASDLVIDPDFYKEQLSEAWPLAEIFDPVGTEILSWSLNVEEEDGIVPGVIGAVQGNRQIVTLDAPNVDFFLWHRSVIPEKYRLWLFTDTSWNSIELQHDTTAGAIREYIKSS
jgi:hypothetical protein